MKKFRFVSMIMAFVMVVSLLPAYALAADITDADGTLIDQSDSYTTTAETDVTITGDLTGELNATEGGTVSMTGNLDGTLSAGNGADITVNGNIDGGESTSPVTVSGEETVLIIVGNVTAAGGTALTAKDTADVTVTGNIETDGNGLSASGEATVQMTGDVDSKATAVSAYGNSDVEIHGDVNSYGDSISCGDNAQIFIEGDVTSEKDPDAESGYSCGISANNNAEIIIVGDLEAEDGVAVKLFAKGNGSNYAEITGDVTGDVIIDIWEDTDKSSTLIVDGTFEGQFLITKVIWGGRLLGHDVMTDFNTSRADVAPNILIWKAVCEDDQYLNGSQEHIEEVTGWSAAQAKGHDVTEQEESDFEGLVYYIVRSDDSVKLTNADSRFDYSTAKEGDVLTFTVKNKKGYKISEITAGDGIDVTDNGDGTYSVTVPRFGGLDLKCTYKRVKEVKTEDRYVELKFDAEESIFDIGATISADIDTNMDDEEIIAASISEEDNAIGSENYTVSMVDGKLTIVFTDEFLSTLSAGSHVFTVCFANGQTYTFTVNK